MDVLLFTHSQDIDGMGCAILARKAFGKFTFVPTKTFDITKNVKEYIDNRKIYSYDKIYVTDLCIKEPVLKLIDQDEFLREHLIVLDHHKTEIEEGNDQYSFVNIIVEKDGKKESGTSLFYEYLLQNHDLQKTNVLDEFVEWTRQYDVYDWKAIHNQKARYLHILFENLGYEKYLELMNDKVDHLDSIIYTDYELSVINQYLESLSVTASCLLDKMKVVELGINNEKYRVGYVRCEYKYRNDINEFVIKDNRYNIDCVGMIMSDIDTVSYRAVKDIDVSIIGKYFGGKGHKGASSNPQSNPKFQELVMKK